MDNQSTVAAIHFGTSRYGHGIFDHVAYPSDTQYPSTILLNSDQTLHSIGQEAKTKYFTLSEKSKSEFSYIENFTGSLFQSKRITNDATILDNQGREVSAVCIFSEVIQHLKQMFPFYMGNSVTEHTVIHWIIVIPDIQIDSVKKFMAEAARKAGIELTWRQIILQSEAAANFCRCYKDALNFRNDTQQKVEKYGLIIIEDKCIEISVHATLEDDQIHELYTTREWLSENVFRKTLENFLKELLGENVWINYREQYSLLYTQLLDQVDFRQANLRTGECITLYLDSKLLKLVEQETGEIWTTTLLKGSHKNIISVNENNQKLTISKKHSHTLFRPVVDGLIYRLSQILGKFEQVTSLMLIEDHDYRSHIRSGIITKFSHLNIISPPYSVVNGAMRMVEENKNLSYIVQRTARFTYGLDKLEEIQGQSEILKVSEHGEEWSDWLIEKMIMKGCVIKTGEVLEAIGLETTADIDRHKTKLTAVWRYSQCENCEILGYIERRPPQNGWPVLCRIRQVFVIKEAGFLARCMNITTKQEDEEYFLF